MRMCDRSDRSKQKKVKEMLQWARRSFHGDSFNSFDSDDDDIDGLPQPRRQVSGADQGDQIIILPQQDDFSCSRASNKAR